MTVVCAYPNCPNDPVILCREDVVYKAEWEPRNLPYVRHRYFCFNHLEPAAPVDRGWLRWHVDKVTPLGPLRSREYEASRWGEEAEL